MNIIWVPRTTWGATAATESFITNRRKVPAVDKTEIHVHHTAAVDADDSTPNRWDYDEAVAYMRKLQTARPDLGPLPYCDNVAVSEDLSTTWVFEGRGALTLGAHTAGHNWAGYGIGVFGNFDRADPAAAKVAVDAIEWRVAVLLPVLVNLGSVKNPRGWNAWGHRDTSTKTCPGHSLYPLLADFNLEDDMPLTEADLDKIRAITREEITLHFGPAWDFDDGSPKGRRYVKALVDSAWHARSGGRKTIQTLDQARNYAKKASELDVEVAGQLAGQVADEFAARLVD